VKGGNKVTLNQTNYYDDWFNGLTDEKAKDCIDGRIFNAEGGNFGECRSVGGGVFEMVIHYGPGYRLYYCQRGKDEYLLLTGGTKKRQQADIERAKEIKGEVERGDRW
jgi:putative addiction module killer protein